MGKTRVCGVARCLATLTLLAVAFAVSAQEGLRDRDPSFAESKKIASDLNQSSAHYGSLYLLSRFQISDIGYTDSTFLPLSAASRGLTFSVNAPQRLYFVPSHKSVYSVEVAPSYTWIRRSEGHNQFGWSTRGDAQYLLNHLYLDFYGIALNDLRPSNTEIDRIVTEKRREGGVKGEIKYSSRTSFLFSGARRNISYPSDRFQPIEVEGVLPLLDHHETDYRLSVLHKTFPLTSLLVASERSNYTFSTNASRDARRTYTGAGFIWQRGGSTWQLEAGPAKVNFHDPGAKDFSGAVGSSSASFLLTPRVGAGLGVSRDVDFSIFATNRYYVFDRAQATANYTATQHLTFRIISQVGRDKYDIPVGGIFRRDQYSFNGIGWNYVVRRLQGGFDVGYYRRTSNVQDGDQQSGIRVLVHLSFKP